MLFRNQQRHEITVVSRHLQHLAGNLSPENRLTFCNYAETQAWRPVECSFVIIRPALF